MFGFIAGIAFIFLMGCFCFHNIINGTNYLIFLEEERKKANFFKRKLSIIQSNNVSLRALMARMDGTWRDTRLKAVEILDTYRDEKNEFVIKFTLVFTQDDIVSRDVIFYFVDFKRLYSTRSYFLMEDDETDDEKDLNTIFLRSNRNVLMKHIIKFDGRFRLLKILNKRNNLKPLHV